MSPNQPVVVSVIVPVYNAGAFLRRTLDCICGQTLRNIEIILVDDGSSDDSRSILQEYVARDSRIILLQQEHEYAGAARNKGLAIARGKYLSFLDADDLFESTMLEKMVARAEEVGADVVVCRCELFYKEGEYTPLNWQIHDRYLSRLDRRKFSLKSEYPQAAFQTFIGWAWDKLFRTEYVQEKRFRFGATRHGNDAPFVFPAIAAADCISIIDESLVKYRKSSGQISAAGNVARNPTACCTCIMSIYNELERIEFPAAILDSFHIWCAHYIKWNMIRLKSHERHSLRQIIIREMEQKLHLVEKFNNERANPYWQEVYQNHRAECIIYCKMIRDGHSWIRDYNTTHSRQNKFVKLFYKKTPTETQFRLLGLTICSIEITENREIFRILNIPIFSF